MSSIEQILNTESSSVYLGCVCLSVRFCQVADESWCSLHITGRSHPVGKNRLARIHKETLAEHSVLALDLI
jgi:hypothetical protein